MRQSFVSPSGSPGCFSSTKMPFGPSKCGEISLDCICRLLVIFNKYYGGRPSAERFDPKRAAPREEIEHSRADNHLTQARKDSRLYAVHCGADTAFRNCQADPAGAAGDHPHGDATGLGVVVASGRAASGGKEGDGSGILTSSTGFFFFFGRSFFPPKKLLSMLLMSRPTTCSTKFVLGRSIVPPT